MLKLRTLTVGALAGRFGHSSGTFGHRRGYIRLVALLHCCFTSTVNI